MQNVSLLDWSVLLIVSLGAIACGYGIACFAAVWKARSYSGAPQRTTLIYLAVHLGASALRAVVFLLWNTGGMSPGVRAAVVPVLSAMILGSAIGFATSLLRTGFRVHTASTQATVAEATKTLRAALKKIQDDE